MKRYTFEIYRDKKKEFRWRLKASNGKMLANAGEGYKRKHYAIKSLNRLFRIIESEFFKIEIRDFTK